MRRPAAAWGERLASGATTPITAVAFAAIALLALTIGLARRGDIPLGILSINLDRRKMINEVCGHEEVDMVLQSVARELGSLRSSDLPERWGGEEFIAVLPDLRCKYAGAFLMRLHAAGMGVGSDRAPVAASVRISERQADAVDEWRRLVEIADQRMHQTMRAGRDCCVGCSDTRLSATASRSPCFTDSRRQPLMGPSAA